MVTPSAYTIEAHKPFLPSRVSVKLNNYIPIKNSVQHRLGALLLALRDNSKELTKYGLASTYNCALT